MGAAWLGADTSETGNFYRRWAGLGVRVARQTIAYVCWHGAAVDRWLVVSGKANLRRSHTSSVCLTADLRLCALLRRMHGLGYLRVPPNGAISNC